MTFIGHQHPSHVGVCPRGQYVSHTESVTALSCVNKEFVRAVELGGVAKDWPVITEINFAVLGLPVTNIGSQLSQGRADLPFLPQTSTLTTL
jgi:hypothetical protein